LESVNSLKIIQKDLEYTEIVQIGGVAFEMAISYLEIIIEKGEKSHH